MKSQLMDANLQITDSRQVNDMLVRVDEYVRREYLSVLSSAAPVPQEQNEIAIGDNLRLMRLRSFTYDQTEEIEQRLRSVYGVLERTGNSAALLLDCREDRAHLYLGVFSEIPTTCSSSYKAFLNSFSGVFPGCEYRNLKRQESSVLLQELFASETATSVAAVSAFSPPDSQEKRPSAAGLEALVDGMKTRPFSMLLLASALDRRTLVQMRQGYEKLYTQISPLRKQDISLSSSNTDTFGLNYTANLSESLSVTTGINQSHTDTRGTGSSTQQQPGQEKQHKQAVNQLLGAGVSLIAGGGPAGNILQNLFLSSSVANILNSASNLMNGQDDEQVTTQSEHEDISDTVGEHKDTTVNQTQGESQGASLSYGATEGRTLAYSMDNKSVEDLLERLSDQIHELSLLENEGAFTTAAYFIAGDEETAFSAASLYRSIVSAGNGNRYYSPVYHWNRPEQTTQILASLMRGTHPAFAFEQFPDNPLISAAQPIGLSDLPRYFCLPKKPLLGFHVTQHAAFARDILRRNSDNSEDVSVVSLGNIYHMGSALTNTPVEIDVNILPSHLFVAGATGVGKSNFCYQLIDQLVSRDINIMIIEPAKGEYARVFGGRKAREKDGGDRGKEEPEFHVYGTNLLNAPPLRINPFAFPKGITSAEHIERLVAIFNAAWPMYSAMPAIMKDALEEIYRKRGFDDIWGDLPEGGSFPCFQDLLETLPEIIRNSEYSQEVQGNYIGALVTRVKSLTNGIYNIIFTDDELSDDELFDRNVIIDISRIGSEETKSLIMGFLITRLSEYRACSGEMNSELRHMTVLEEAHHLLGRHTQASSPDTGNMRGASVELISNAIREMRTYGEGFLIADQSAALMDPSVISNTQTKVFFMMPRREDLSVACDAASLSEVQGKEIAKLPRGVAMVFQNEWTDAILCKVNFFDANRQPPYQYTCKETPESTAELARKAVRILIRKKCNSAGERVSPTEMPDASFWDSSGFALGKKRKFVRRILERYRDKGEQYIEPLRQCGPMLEALLDMNHLLQQNRNAGNIRSWAEAIHKAIREQSGLDREEVHLVISTVLLSRAEKSGEYRNLYTQYLVYEHDSVARDNNTGFSATVCSAAKYSGGEADYGTNGTISYRT